MKSVLIFRRMPFLRLLVPLVLGICGGFYLPIFGWYGYCSFLLGAMMLGVAVIPSVSKSFRYRWLFGVLLFGTLFFLGAYRTIEEKSRLKELSLGEESMLVAELTGELQEKSNSYAVEVSVKETSMKRGEYALLVYVAKDSLSKSLSRGDVIAFPNNLFRKRVLNPGEFDFEAYLRLKGISGSCYLPNGKWRRIGHNERFSLFSLASEIQQSLLDKLVRYGLSGDEMAVVSAMVLGNRDHMEASLRSSYSATGASHILAVSGLHVGVVFLVLDFVLKQLFRSRFRCFRISLLIVSLWAYAFITGLPASVVRASFMLSFVCVGKMLGRSSSVFNTVSASAFFMLIYNPFYLFDVGFQLSYAAVFSILLFQPKIKAFWEPQHKILDWGWSLFSVSIAAQLGTLPIVLYNFHQFANYFWLSGMWVVPLSAVVIYATLFFFLLPEVEVVCSVVAQLLSWVAWLMNAGVQWMVRLPCALIEGIRYGGSEVVLSYIIVIMLALSLFQKNLRWIRMTLLSMVFVPFLWSVNGCRVASQEGVVVYNIKGVSVINRYGQNRNELSCEGDVELVRKRVSSFWVEHNLPEVKASQQPFFILGDQVIYCFRDSSLKGKVALQPLSVDVLVIGKDAVDSLEDVCRLFTFRQLVLDSSNSWRCRNRIVRECEKANIACWDVAESGAWMMEE